jgi:hypothetical protein
MDNYRGGRMKLKGLFAASAIALAAIAVDTSRAQGQDPAARDIYGMMVSINAQLEASGSNYRLDQVEYLTNAESGAIGQTVFFNNRGNKQLPAHFVPGDPRRDGRTNITYIADNSEGAVDALTPSQTSAAFDRAMATWNGVNCSSLAITRLAPSEEDIGFIEFVNGLGGDPNLFADVVHAGWVPAGTLPPNVIAATFTVIFIDDAGAPTDIDGNGLPDVATREILYHDNFVWQINANIDVETIALHEAGHGLSQGHFGKAFVTNSNGKLHFSPRAVMNAAYSGVQQQLAGTDNGGHCSIWGSWPNN